MVKTLENHDMNIEIDQLLLKCTFFLGNGGSTDTANTARRFLGEKRNAFLELVQVSTVHFDGSLVHFDA